MAESRQQQIKNWLKQNAGLEFVLEALGGIVLTRHGHTGRCQCINPDHDDSPRRGGSMSLDFNTNHWKCFACASVGYPRGGDIFDLFALRNRLQPGLPASFMASLKGVAEICAAQLATHFGANWRDAFGAGRRSSSPSRFTQTLASLPPIDPKELPVMGLGTDARLPGYWLTPGSEPFQVLSSTAGPDIPAIRAHTGRVRLVVFEALGMMAFCREDWSLLGTTGDEPSSFTKRVGVPDVTNGRYLNGLSAPTLAESIVSLSFVVENPLDLHMLGLAGQPAVLGRFTAVGEPMNAQPADGRILALLALLPTIPKGAALRFERILKYGQAWIPKTHPLQDTSCLVTLSVEACVALALRARREAQSPTFRVAPLL